LYVWRTSLASCDTRHSNARIFFAYFTSAPENKSPVNHIYVGATLTVRCCLMLSGQGGFERGTRSPGAAAVLGSQLPPRRREQRNLRRNRAEPALSGSERCGRGGSLGRPVQDGLCLSNSHAV